MLDQQIEQSRARRAASLRKGLIACLGLLGAILLAYSLVHFIDTRPAADPVTDVGVTPAPPAVENDTATIDNKPLNSEADRKQFQQMLSQFEEVHASRLSDQDFLNWQPHTAADPLDIKTQALALFAAGSYTHAITTLEQANDTAIRLHNEWQAAYEDKLNRAQHAYDNGEIKPAQLHLNQAFKIKSSEERGLALQKKLTSHPRVAKLLQQLNVANVENNLHKQAGILGEIVTVDPTRTEMKKTLQGVRKKINDAAFSRYLAQGLSAIDSGQINDARTAYRHAKNIYAKRPELNTLQQKITDKKTANEFNHLIRQLAEAAQSDNWASVAGIAQSPYQTDPQVQAYLNDAAHILRLQKQANHYLDRPERLLDKNIRTQAKKFIKEHFRSTLKSPQFAKQINALSETIRNAEIEQPLRITSNGETDIWVLGVGHVGETTQKDIVLPPGRYTLEGRCDGYRHKQLTVALPGQHSIHLVCDERIR